MTTQIPAQDPDDVGRGIAALEEHLAAQAPTAEAAEAALVALPDGETKRVRQLRAEVAEAHQLAKLQDDDTALQLDTPKVRKRRAKAHEAARLHALAQDPAMRAYGAARVRRLLVSAGMVSLTLALAWSTAGVQVFAADGAPAGSPAWVFAWLVEPFMSIALLTVVGAKAYLGTKGQPIKNTTLTRVEALFLGLTLGMNAWPYLPKVAEEFSFSRLVLHLLGPVVAVAIVTALPIILEAFARLDHGGPTQGLTGLTGREYRRNAAAGTAPGSPSGADLGVLIARTESLIAAGTLPVDPSATAIRQALRCGTDTARQVRDAVRGGDR